MQILLGLDPGGAGNFGWCITQYTDYMPTIPITCGLANNAQQAIYNALAAIPEGDDLVAVGIDAPLFWSKTGSRNADLTVRYAIKQAGAPHASGTVQDVNSLRGACLIQGMLAALELREKFPKLLITEAHPKALRWLLPSLVDIEARSEHERDAILATVSAWAAFNRPKDWEDLFIHEENAFTPISMPVLYMMPNVSDIKLKQEPHLDTGFDESITRVILVANEVFENKAKAMRWLNSPRKELMGKTPLETASTVRGRETVLKLIGRIDHGIFA